MKPLNEIAPNSRYALILSIFRYCEAHCRQKFTNTDEIISHLYIRIDEYLKERPLADVPELKKFGYKECKKFVNAQRFHLSHEQKLERVQPTQAEIYYDVDRDKLLHLWCENRSKREGKNTLARLVSYLHLVEGMTHSELADYFNISYQAVNNYIHDHKRKRREMPHKKNDVVMLVMDNPFFHGMLAWIKEPTEWGAVVEVESHNYPERRRWELRALISEMVYIGSLATIPEMKQPSDVDGRKHIVSNSVATHNYTTAYVEPSKQVSKRLVAPPDIPNGLHDPNVYLLDECPQCGQMKLRRNGPCLICDACGTTTGCG